jgi:hypothetical protein
MMFVVTRPGASRTITLHDRDHYRVVAETTSAGDLLIRGHDSRYMGRVGESYEWDVTVLSADIPMVVAALEGRHGVDPLALLHDNADAVMRTGVKAWLEDHGVPLKFSCY